MQGDDPAGSIRAEGRPKTATQKSLSLTLQSLRQDP